MDARAPSGRGTHSASTAVSPSVERRTAAVAGAPRAAYRHAPRLPTCRPLPIIRRQKQQQEARSTSARAAATEPAVAAAIEKEAAVALAVAITAVTQPARPAVSRCTCQLPPRPRRRRFSQQVSYPTRRRRPPHPLPSQRWLAGSAAVMPAPRHRRVFDTLMAANGATAAPARDDGGTGGSSSGGNSGDGGDDSPDAQSCCGSARVGWSGHCCIGVITHCRAQWAHGA